MTADRVKNAKPRAWQRMLSGRRLDLLDPHPSDIEIADIAHGLARVARWNGQTHGPHALSVAQHAVIVTDIALALEPGLDPSWQRAALLHDAPEYVIGDLISPFKAAIGLDYKSFEERLLAAIHTRFSLPYPLSEDRRLAIKRADRVAAYYEAVGLAGFSSAEAAEFFGPVEVLPEPAASSLMDLTPWSVSDAEAQFYARWRELEPTSAQLSKY